MNIKPLGDRILVKPLEEEAVTQSGIILPDTADKEKKEQGEIIAIGDGEDVTKLGINIGDIVMFGKYAGEDVEVDKVDYKFLKDDEVLAVVQKEQN